MFLNTIYNFSTLAPSILGAAYTNMKVKAIVAADEAIKLNGYSDITTTHAKLKPLITGLPDSVNDCTFILFENTSKETMLIALEYIDSNSIVVVQSVNIRLNVLNVSTDDISILRVALTELGYNNIEVSTF